MGLKGKAIWCYVLVWQQLTYAGRPMTSAAFVVRARTRGLTRRDVFPANRGRCHVRRKPTSPVFLATEDSTTKQLSEIDARVLDELLGDPTFVKSLMKQEVPLPRVNFGNMSEEIIEEESPNMQGSTRQTSVGLMVSKTGKEIGAGEPSIFESGTMRIAEGLQESVQGVIAKITAAIESAGILVSNRAQSDTKVVAAVISYASKQAVAGTGRLLGAATDVIGPAFQLVGINVTETRANLNVSLELLSLGMAPDSLNKAPTLLPSLKDFDDDDKRLDAAYRRQRRRRSKPLPVKLLGTLPSTLNKAADLAYEVGQEVKYERAGSRTNKLLQPIGISLPQPKDTKFILGGNPTLMEEALLEDSVAERVIPRTRILSDRDEIVASAAARTNEVLEDTQSSWAVGKLRGQPEVVLQVSEDAPRGVVVNADRVESNADLFSASPSRSNVLVNELTMCLEEVDRRLQWQQRNVRAAEAVLCSTEPVINSLEDKISRDVITLRQLEKMAKGTQQATIIAELAEARDAAHAHIRRLEVSTSNVRKLQEALIAHVESESASKERLTSIRPRVARVQDATMATTTEGTMDQDVDDTLDLLDEVRAEISALTPTARVVEEQLAIIKSDYADRVGDSSSNVHEDALAAATRLWEISFSKKVTQQVMDTTIRNEDKETTRPAGQASHATNISPEPARKAPQRDRPAGERLYSPRVDALYEPPMVDAATASKEVRDVKSSGRLTSNQVTPANPFQSAKCEPQREGPINDPLHLDATVVSDSVSGTNDDRSTQPRYTMAGEGPIVSQRGELASITFEESGIEVLVGESSSVVVDAEADIEDDGPDALSIALKVLDVMALLVEKILLVGVPTVASGGALVWDRVDNAMNGAKGRKGWRLLSLLKKE